MRSCSRRELGSGPFPIAMFVDKTNNVQGCFPSQLAVLQVRLDCLEFTCHVWTVH
jgi:hypothetical protein